MGCNCNNKTNETNSLRKAIDIAKFGTCSICINATIGAFIGSWLFTFLMLSYVNGYYIKLFATIPSMIFSIWMCLHIIGYLKQKSRKLRS